MDDPDTPPQPKRRRVLRACDQCRLRKTRCDGRSPCASCTANGVDCTDTRPSRRSTGANYIEQLEKKVKELEALIGGSAAIDDHGDDDQFDIFDESNGAETQHERATDPPSHRHIHRSSDPNAVLSAADEEMLETMIPVSDSSPMPGEGLSAYRGRFAGLSLLERLRNLCSRLAGQAEKRPADSSREDFVYAFDYPSPTSNPIEPSDGFAILPAKGTILQRVQIAFDQACCLMQFMHQPTVESHIHCIYAIEPEHYTKEDRKFLALLYALLALGTRFAEDDPKGVQSNGVQTLSKGAGYLRTSRRLIDIADCHCLISIQTVMCIVLYLQSDARMSASYSYICAAVAASLRIGLHMSVASQGLDSIERETRTRTFSVLNIMETYVTTALGLPKTLRDVNSDQLLPSDVDSTTSKSPFSSPIDDPTSPTAVTQAHARLIMIMAKAVQSIHPTNRPDYRQNGFYGVKYFHITEAEAELETWFRQLPQVPNVDQAEDGTIVRSQLLLRLAYGHVQMILYRPFLHHVVRDVPGSVFHFRSYACGSACVKAAMQVIWIAEALDVRGFLSEAYWFTVLILSAATTSLLVFILGNKGDPTIKETVQAVTRAKNILARLAARSPTARRCLASLKGLDDVTDRSNGDSTFAFDHAATASSSQPFQPSPDENTWQLPLATTSSELMTEGHLYQQAEQDSHTPHLQAMVHPEFQPYLDPV